MRRVIFGDKNVGVQGIYYFEDDAFVDNFAAKIKPFLDSLRNGTDYWKTFMEEWKHEHLLYNFLIACKDSVEVEKETPETWWMPGGSLYGEKWRNFDLPNGRGQYYCGDKLIETNEEDNNIQANDINILYYHLNKLTESNVISQDEFDAIIGRIKSKEAFDTLAKMLEEENNQED